jgi:DNA replication and repair protein RecF
VLERRNHLLRSLRDRRDAADQLEFWDHELTREGAKVIARRQRAVLELEALAQPIHRDLSGDHEQLRLRYLPSFDPWQTDQDSGQLRLSLDVAPPISLPQDAETIEQAFLESLRSSRREEIQRGMTLLGPHRDDARFFDGQIDLHTYGSRGQQRTAVLALKLAEVALMRRTTGEQPILLLDEVMSELDLDRRRYLCEQLNKVEQALITTTDLDALTRDVLAQATLFHVAQGHLEPVHL